MSIQKIFSKRLYLKKENQAIKSKKELDGY